ncbi:MAG: NAD(P)/FAD-dependent oxidoreductase [Candidatus Hodarchaeales archaeon]
MEKKIAGAGISGLSAAITIKNLRKDIDVSIRDKATSIREKIPRGVNTLRNYGDDIDVKKQYQDMGFKINNFHPIKRQFFILGKNKTFQMESKKKPIFYTTIRGTDSGIDNMLLEQAKELKIEVNWSSTYEKEKPDILATGTKFSHCFGYGQHFVDVEETETIYIMQNSKYSPFGYMCILPYSKNEATLILGNFNPSEKIPLKENYRRILSDFPQFRDYTNGATVKYDLHGIGNFGIPSTSRNGSTILVGERAGFLEAYRGYGIHNAIISGYTAALSLVNGSDYDKLWKDMLLKSLERGLMRRLAENKLNISSERILNELYEKITLETSWGTFRSELKKMEKKFLQSVDLNVLMESMSEWNKKYKFISD